jgi:hypothetical protein
LRNQDERRVEHTKAALHDDHDARATGDEASQRKAE